MNSSSISTETTLDPSLLKVDLRTIYYLGLAQKLKVFEVHLSLTKMRVKLVLTNNEHKMQDDDGFSIYNPPRKSEA